MRDVTYHKRYEATVERFNGDGSFDLLPSDDAMKGRGLQRVRERVGLAGAASYLVKPGTRCLFGFRNGDPRAPEIVAWEFQKDSAVVSLNGGRARVARKGDSVKVPAGTAVTGVVNGTLTVPGTPPVVTPVVGLPFVGTATLAGPVRARIIGGARRVKS